MQVWVRTRDAGELKHASVFSYHSPLGARSRDCDCCAGIERVRCVPVLLHQRRRLPRHGRRRGRGVHCFGFVFAHPPIRYPPPHLRHAQVVRIYSTSDGMQVATQRHSTLPVLAVDISPSGVNGISCWYLLFPFCRAWRFTCGTYTRRGLSLFSQSLQLGRQRQSVGLADHDAEGPVCRAPQELQLCQVPSLTGTPL